MMDFKAFADTVNRQYNAMAISELYTTNITDDELYAVYLNAFPAGTDPIFRSKTSHDCNCCRKFITRLGSLVYLQDGQITTVWDTCDKLEEPYNIVAKALADAVRSAGVNSVFRTSERQYGTEQTADAHIDGHVWDHLYGKVADRHFSLEPAAEIGRANTAMQVFARGMAELSVSSIETVVDLIKSDSLYRGQEHLQTAENFLALKKQYDLAPDNALFVLQNFKRPAAQARNAVIGTLIIDISEGVELERAVNSFETKVAPQNFKRNSSPITSAMVESADKKLKELGLEGAVHRRHAKMADMSVNNVLFVDNSAQSQMKDGIAGLLADVVTKNTTEPKNSTEISIDDFVATVLPEATSVKVHLKNANLPNFVSMTAGDGPERMFKWDNNFSFAYDGDAADSIKQRVKAAGGRVDEAKLRVSLSWYNTDDLDIHASAPGKKRIYYGDKQGVLDVDMNVSGESTEPVENLSWVDTLSNGVYKIAVNNYTNRNKGVNGGFDLEVECNGIVHNYHSKTSNVTLNEYLLEITVLDGTIALINHTNVEKSGNVRPTDKWGVSTENLIPVDTVLLSPNYWDDNAVGQCHWMFILKDCLNPDPVRGFFNENLRADLVEHRKVFEILGSKTKAPFSPDQLSGVGFTKGRDDSLIVVVETAKTTRSYTIKF